MLTTGNGDGKTLLESERTAEKRNKASEWSSFLEKIKKAKLCRKIKQKPNKKPWC